MAWRSWPRRARPADASSALRGSPARSPLRGRRGGRVSRPGPPAGALGRTAEPGAACGGPTGGREHGGEAGRLWGLGWTVRRWTGSSGRTGGCSQTTEQPLALQLLGPIQAGAAAAPNVNPRPPEDSWPSLGVTEPGPGDTLAGMVGAAERDQGPLGASIFLFVPDSHHDCGFTDSFLPAPPCPAAAAPITQSGATRLPADLG